MALSVNLQKVRKRDSKVVSCPPKFSRKDYIWSVTTFFGTFLISL